MKTSMIIIRSGQAMFGLGIAIGCYAIWHSIALSVVCFLAFTVGMIHQSMIQRQKQARADYESRMQTPKCQYCGLILDRLACPVCDIEEEEQRCP